MSQDLEEKWEGIARETIEAAEGVECPFADFVEGLRGIIGELRDRLSCAEEELRAMEGSDE